MTKTMRAAVAWGLVAALGGCGGAAKRQGGSGGPALDLAPSAVTFAPTVAGAAAPAAQVVTITNRGGGTLAAPTATVATDGAWLDATVAPAAGGYTLTLRPNTTALPERTYATTVQVASAGADDSPFPVSVLWGIVAAAPAGVALSHTSLDINATVGSDPVSTSIQVTNAGGGTLGLVTATPRYNSGAGWMTVAVAGSGNAQTVTVTVAPRDTGSYSGALSIAAEGAVGGPVSVPVSLRVHARSASDVAAAFKVVGYGFVDRQLACASAPSSTRLSSERFIALRAGKVALAVLQGRLTWDQAAADACRAWIEGASCAQLEAAAQRGPPAACDGLGFGLGGTGGGMLAGRVENGSACSERIECARGWCAYGSACPGTCTPFTASGAACSGLDCAPGEDCGSAGCAPAATPAASGAPCASGSPACATGLYCDGAVCAPRKGAGTPCAGVPGACDAGLSCGKTSGACVRLAGESEPCGDAACGRDLFCEASSATCRLLPKKGERCAAAGACLVDGSRCLGTVDPVCTEGTAAEGAACTPAPTAATSPSDLCAPAIGVGFWASAVCAAGAGSASPTCRRVIDSCY